MIDTERAVRRFQRGEQEAFADIVKAWQGRLYNFALRYLGSPEDAQDVLQETFLSAFRGLGSLRDTRTFPAWLFKVLLNHCRAYWRSRPPEIPLEEHAETQESGGKGLALTLAYPRNDHQSVEMRDLLRKAMLGLSEDHRAAILLKEYLGLSLEEVAGIMECPLSTAKSRLYHGLRNVQRNLQRLGVGAGARGTQENHEAQGGGNPG